MKRLRFIIFPILAGLLLGYFVRQPYLGNYALSPESVIDISTAINMAEHKGMTLSLKWIYFPETPLVRPSVGERGVIYPYLISRVMDRTYRLELINIIASFAAGLLFFALVRKAFDDRVAWLSYIWFIFHPLINQSAAYITNFVLLLLLAVLTGWILISYEDRAGTVIAGGVMGFSFWVEPWAIFSFLAFLPGMIIGARLVKSGFARASAFTLGFLLTSAPLMYLIYSIHGTPIPIHIPTFFRVRDHVEFMFRSYGASPPGVIEFVAANIPFILGRVASNLKTYLHVSFFLNGSWPILFCLPALFAAGRKAYQDFPSRFLPLISYSVFFLLGAGLVWSRLTTGGSPVIISLFIVPALFYFLCRVKAGDFPAGFLAAVLVITLTVSGFTTQNHGPIAENIKRFGIDIYQLPERYNEKWLASHKDEEMRIAAVHPWKIFMISNKECGILPVNLPPEKLREFCEKFGYNYLINNDLDELSAELLKNMGGKPPPWLERIEHNIWKVKSPQNE